MRKIWILAFISSFCILVESANYVFVPADEAIFQACDNNKNDIHTIFDLSQLKTTHGNDEIEIKGSFKAIWDGVTPSHRILAKGDVFRQGRQGEWQPTALAMQRADFCKVFSKQSEIWYDGFVKYIPEDERVCFDHVGQVYNVQPFSLNLYFKNIFNNDLSGNYKITVNLEAINEDGDRDANACFEIRGELNKI